MISGVKIRVKDQGSYEQPPSVVVGVGVDVEAIAVFGCLGVSTAEPRWPAKIFPSLFLPEPQHVTYYNRILVRSKPLPAYTAQQTPY